jgi:hypothetical protein
MDAVIPLSLCVDDCQCMGEVELSNQNERFHVVDVTRLIRCYKSVYLVLLTAAMKIIAFDDVDDEAAIVPEVANAHFFYVRDDPATHSSRS